MVDLIDKKGNRRSIQRLAVNMKAHSYLEHSHSHQDCTIIDISMTGAAVMLPKDENAAKGDTIFLEVMKGLESIGLRGRIVWWSHAKNGYYAGVRFNKPIDKNTLHLLA